MMPAQVQMDGTAPCCQLSSWIPVAPVQNFDRSSNPTPVVLPAEASKVPVAPELGPRFSERTELPRATGHSPQALNCVFLV